MSSRIVPSRRLLSVATLATCVLAWETSPGIGNFPGYSAEANDLFSAWNTPGGAVVRNTDPDFVGAGLDFSGIGYGIQSEVVSRAFLSPLHVASAAHTSAFPSSGQFFVADNAGFAPVLLGNGSSESLGVTGYDHSIGTLTAGHIAPDAGITTYAILDLETPASYVGMEVFEVGHGNSSLTESPRAAVTTITGAQQAGSSSTFYTNRPPAPLQGGDSGGPTMAAWTNPLGEEELTFLGTHYGTDQSGNTLNYSNFFASTYAINAANAVMVDDGFAVRLVGKASTQWTSAASSNFATGGNWSSGSPLSTAYVVFDAASATQRTIDFAGGTGAMRGLLFGAGNVAEGFTFQNGTLQIGRGGIANYSAATQTLSADLAIALTDHQYWDAIHGDLDVASGVNLNGKLLVVQGDHDTTLSGVVSDSTGTGPGFTKYGLGTLTLDAAATYSGKTWIYGGTVSLGTNGALPSGGALVLANNATARLEMNGKSVGLSSLNSVAGQPGAQGTIDLGAGGLLTIDQATGSSNFSGGLTGGTNGTTSVRLIGSTVTNNVINLTGSSNYAGRTLIERGNVYINSAGALGAAGAGNETFVNFTDAVKPTVRLGGVGIMQETVVLRNSSTTSGGTASVTLNLTSANLTMEGPIVLQRDTTLANRATSWTLGSVNSSAFVADVHLGDITGELASGAVAGSSSLIFQHYQDSVFHLDGVISNGTLGSALAVNHRGLGTIEINATNTYTGATSATANRVIAGVDSLSGQAGAFGNATSAITVGNQNLSHTTGLYAADGVTIGRGLILSNSNTTGVIVGALENATAMYSGTVSLGRTETILSAGTGSQVTFSNTISGSGAPKIVKQGAGTVILSGVNTYSGGTTVQEGRLRASNAQALGSTGTVLISGGILEIAAGVTLGNSDVQLQGGELEVNGTLNALDFQAGTISGAGILNASLTLDSLSHILSPGNSPGTMTVGGNQTWTGFTYEWEMRDFTGDPGTETDLLAFSSSLTLGGDYVLDVISLTPGNLAGDVANFSETSQSWTILTASGGITGFDAAEWTIDTSAFTAAGGWTGGFSLARQGGSLVLSYSAVPEPASAVLILLGSAGLLQATRRRRIQTHTSLP